MSNHRIKFYMDGYKKVEFCSVCGKEEGNLILYQCVVDKPNKNQLKLFEAKISPNTIDKEKEPS